MTTSRIEPRQPRISVIFDRPRVTVRTAAQSCDGQNPGYAELLFHGAPHAAHHEQITGIAEHHRKVVIEFPEIFSAEKLKDLFVFFKMIS